MSNADFNRSMQYLRVNERHIIAYSSLCTGQVTVSRLTNHLPGQGITAPHATEDATLVSLQLENYRGRLWRNGRSVPMDAFGRGELSTYDLRESWKADLMTAFDCLNFHIPHARFRHLLPHAVGSVERLSVAPGRSVADAVLSGLGQVFCQTMLTPHLASRLFTDHLELTLLAHLGMTYGGLHERSRQGVKGGLCARDFSRAKEMIEAGLEGSVSVEELAAACGLSAGHFSRAFRQSAGMPAHQWLLHRRVIRAKHLLSMTEMRLGDIAAACGFADQPHLCRVFQRLTGLTPRAWRNR